MIKIYTLTILFFSMSWPIVFGQTIHISHSETAEQKAITTIKMTSKSSGSVDVWTKQKDCKCTIDPVLYEDRKSKPLFTCVIKGAGSKTQVEVVCSLNNSEANALSLFACMTNYEIWCSEK